MQYNKILQNIVPLISDILLIGKNREKTLHFVVAKNVQKKMKKVVDKGEMRWYYLIRCRRKAETTTLIIK